MRPYNSRTKRRRDLQFGAFCVVFFRPGDLYFRFDILPTQTKYSTKSGNVWKITCTNITRELNAVETCDFDHFVAIFTVHGPDPTKI